MNCASMQERLTVRLTGGGSPGELGQRELAELEAHLAECAACAADAALAAELWQRLGEMDTAVPTANLRRRFDAMLAEALAAEPAGTREQAGPARASSAPAPASLPAAAPVPRRLRRRATPERRFLALAAMLLVGLGIGYLLFGRRAADVLALQREVGDLHELVALSLLERGSVSERLQGVSYGRNLSTGDDRFTSALFARLLEDPNVNVRLAALEALRPVVRRDDRRGQLVAAVTQQDSPLVALSLIDLLLESGSAAARHDLEQLLANPKLDPAVAGYLRDRLGRSA